MSQVTHRAGVPLPPVPGHRPLAGVPSDTYLSPVELVDHAATAEERHPAAEHNSSTPGVWTDVYATSNTITPRQSTYANTTDSTEEGFVELY